VAHFRGYITAKPALAAAKMLRAKLVDRGIKVGGRARVGRADPSSTVLATEQSPALRWLVRTMDRQSDNFYAEMFTKLVGALEAGEGSTAAGTTVIRTGAAFARRSTAWGRARRTAPAYPHTTA
jgi:D-alanyl-D-alanine carboxypeptidase